MLTSIELINIIINKFKEQEIYLFSKKEFKKQIKYFMKNEKYNLLFDYNMNIDEAIDIFIQCGYLYQSNTDKDTIYILKDTKKKNFDIALEQALNSYCDIKKICQKYTDLNIYLYNPNNKYVIVTGKVLNHIINWTLHTDGTILKNDIKLVKGTKHTFNNPFTNEEIYFDDSNFEYVDVIDASYVFRQQIINNKVTANLLYVNSSSKREIESLAKTFCKRSR